MRITVIGGTGLIGTRLVARLGADGHDVVAGSRATGVDSYTGEGLAEALAGTKALIDVSKFRLPRRGGCERVLLEVSGNSSEVVRSSMTRSPDHVDATST